MGVDDYAPSAYDDEGEYTRLRAMEASDDPETFASFARVGLTGPFHAPAEVGVGAGGVAEWMAARLAPGARVTIVDFDPRFVPRMALDDPVVVVADIVEVDLEPRHDLIHCRYVLQHVSDPARALANLAAGLAPGGWLVVEDSHWHSVVADRTHPDAALFDRVNEALAQVAAGLGIDTSIASRLPGMVDDLGLVDRGERIWQYFERGDASAGARANAAPRLGADAVAAGHISESDLARYLELIADPTMTVLGESTASVWGRRPD